MIIADTDVLIDYMGGHEPAAGRITEALEKQIVRTTAVTVFELWSGAKTQRQRKAVESLLELVPDFPLDRQAAERAARVRRELEVKGSTIGMGDSLIAGIVLVQDGKLMTRNRRHFERVEDLTLVALESAAVRKSLSEP